MPAECRARLLESHRYAELVAFLEAHRPELRYRRPGRLPSGAAVAPGRSREPHRLLSFDPRCRAGRHAEGHVAPELRVRRGRRSGRRASARCRTAAPGRTGPRSGPRRRRVLGHEAGSYLFLCGCSRGGRGRLWRPDPLLRALAGAPRDGHRDPLWRAGGGGQRDHALRRVRGDPDRGFPAPV